MTALILVLALLSPVAPALATADEPTQSLVIETTPAPGPVLAEEPAAARPTIGLALSGGGAKGLAHIGVLKVFEEMRIPIDYVSGTSMGAIVGGLYAAGMSAAELEEVVLALDWDDLLEDEPSRRDLAYRRKADDLRYLADVELGLRDWRLRWPVGLRSGQKLMFMLQRYTLQAAGVSDFDRLPIPFRCVATDITTGEMVVLGQGDLAYSLRASMAIPAYFSPVELDGRLLVDGAAVNNIPVDVVEDLGADVLIAVDISAQLARREELDSFTAILAQSLGLQNRKNMESRLALADLVITPDVTSFGVLEFNAGRQIIDFGEEQARAQAADLARYALSEEAYRQHLAARPPLAPLPAVIDEIRFEGNERVDDRIIAHQLHATTGAPLDPETLAADLGRVYGLGDFELIDFALERDEAADRDTVVIRALEKPWGPNYLRFGLFVESDFDQENAFSVLLDLTMTRLNPRGGEWRNDLQFGRERLLASEFYQPLDFKGRWFVAPSLEWRREVDDFFAAGQAVAELEVRRAKVAVDFGYQISRFGELRLGLERGNATVDLLSGEGQGGVSADVELDDIDFGAVVFEGTFDSLDSAGIPRRGGFARLRGFLSSEGLGADMEYDRWELRSARFLSRGRHTFVGSLDGGWSPGGELPVYDEFTLGGFLSLSGFQEDQLRGQYYGVARFGYYYRLFGSFYAGGWIETGNVWQSSDDLGDDLVEATTIFLGAETLVGPLYVGYGFAEGGDDSFYLSVGRSF